MAVTILVALASAGILSGIVDAISVLIGEYGYPAVFAAAFLEVIFPPIPSEVIFHLWVLLPKIEDLDLKIQLAWRP